MRKPNSEYLISLAKPAWLYQSCTDSQNASSHHSVSTIKKLSDPPAPNTCPIRNTESKVPRPISMQLLDITNESSGQPLPVLHHPHNSDFQCWERNSCILICPFPLVLPLSATEKNLSLSSLHPPFRYLWTLMRSPESLLQADLSQVS